MAQRSSEEARRSPSVGALWATPTPTRLYAAGRGEPRARRPTDVVLLAACVFAGLVVGQAASPPSGVEAALIDLAAALPSFLGVVWHVVAGLGALWAALLVVASIVRRRTDVLRDAVVALGGAVALVALVGERVAGGRVTGRSLLDAVSAGGPPPEVVSLRVALVAAVCVVVSPHLARPFRATSRWAVGLGALGLVALGAATPSGAVLGVVAGTAAAAIVHLAFGSSGGRMSHDDIRRGLAELGVEVTELADATRQRSGVHLVEATGSDGRALVVKVYGRDAWDGQLLAKAWRAAWYRDAEALTLTRLQQAEHEGFVTLLAARHGVPVADVVRAGRTRTNDALLVLAPRGEPIRPDDAAGSVDAIWASVRALGDAGFAHGDLAPERFRRDGEVVAIDDLAGATVSPSGDQRRADHAQVLVSLALLVGPDAAVASAREHLGADGLADAVPYLQRAALGPRLREAIADAPGTEGAERLDLDDLRARAAEAAGVEEPHLARLRRLSTATLVRAVLLVAVAYLLISMLSGVDVEQLVDALGEASLPILVVALVLAQAPRFAQAESTRGACPRPIAYGPVLLLQFAISFVNLVIPSTAARISVNVRFFQRQGIPPASAVSIGLVDSLGGFVVQLGILGSVLLFDLGHVGLDLDRPADGAGGLVTVVVALAALVVLAGLAAAAVPSLRAKAIERVRPWIAEALETVHSLRSPAKVARVIGGNLASEVLFACTLAVVLAAFGESAPLATLLVVNVSVALFAGLMPVPGGIGVTEGALVVGLTAAGLDQATAFAAVIAYRLCTYYLPPIWGAVALRRLERAGML